MVPVSTSTAISISFPHCNSPLAQSPSNHPCLDLAPSCIAIGSKLRSRSRPTTRPMPTNENSSAVPRWRDDRQILTFMSSPFRGVLVATFCQRSKYYVTTSLAATRQCETKTYAAYSKSISLWASKCEMALLV